MKKRIFIITLLSFLICFNIKAQKAFVLNEHSQIVPLNQPINLKIIHKRHVGCEITGDASNIIQQMSGSHIYIKCSPNESIKSWIIVPLNSQKKGKRIFLSGIAHFGGPIFPAIPLRYEQVYDDIYRIIPKIPFEEGEYSLFRIGDFYPVEVYDFRIDNSISSTLSIPSNKSIVVQIQALR